MGWRGFLAISNRPREEMIFPNLQSRAVLTRGNYQLSIINYQLMKTYLGLLYVYLIRLRNAISIINLQILTMFLCIDIIWFFSIFIESKKYT